MKIKTDTRLGPYRLVRPLGKGGMGEVWIAVDTRLNRQVALKFLSESISDDEVFRKRFVREAQAASGLEHPNICTIHQIDETDDGLLYISMPYYTGKPLRELVQEGSLSFDAALDIAKQIAKGLQKAHEAGIVHRDIKAANLIVTQDGIVKILDFGLAKRTAPSDDSDLSSPRTPDAQLTGAGTTLGTVAYMSPQQVKGEILDGRTDIFSLGVVMYEMFTGTRPFQGGSDYSIVDQILHHEPPSPRVADVNLPAELEPIISKSLSKDTAARYQRASELLHDLNNVPRTTTQTTMMIEPPPPRPRRFGVWAGAALLGVIVVFFLVAFGGRLFGPTERPSASPHEARDQTPLLGSENNSSLDESSALGLRSVLDEPGQADSAADKKQPVDERQGLALQRAREQGELIGAARTALAHDDLPLAQRKLSAYRELGGDPDEAAALENQIDARQRETAVIAEQQIGKTAALEQDRQRLLSLVYADLGQDDLVSARDRLQEYERIDGNRDTIKNLEARIASRNEELAKIARQQEEAEQKLQQLLSLFRADLEADDLASARSRLQEYKNLGGPYDMAKTLESQLAAREDELTPVLAPVMPSDRETKIEELITIFSEGTLVKKKAAVKALGWQGITDHRVYDPIEKFVLANYETNVKDRAHNDSIAWLLKGLAYSGDTKYLPTISQVANGSNRYILKHASNSIPLLETYGAWNRIMNDEATWDKSQSDQTNRFANMLRADDLALKQMAAKRIIVGGDIESYLLDVMQSQVLAVFEKQNNDKQFASTYAYYCKAMAISDDGKYTATVFEVADGAGNPLLSNYAKRYIKSYALSQTP